MLVNVPATAPAIAVHTNFWFAPTAIAGALARAGAQVNPVVAPAKLSSVTTYDVSGEVPSLVTIISNANVSPAL